MIFGSNRQQSVAFESNRASKAIDSHRWQSAAIAKSIAIGGIRLLSIAFALTASADEPFLGGFVSAVSPESAAVRLEARNMALVAPRVVAGTQNLVSSNGLTTTSWDTTALANGWQEVTEPTGGEKASLLVANLPSIAVEGGRLQSSVTWGADAVHWVRNKVIIPRGVTLTVAAGAIVKFGEQTGMFVEDGGTVKFNGNSSAQVVLTSFADDVYGGDSERRLELVVAHSAVGRHDQRPLHAGALRHGGVAPHALHAGCGDGLAHDGQGAGLGFL